MATTKKNIVEIKPDISAQVETLRNDVAELTKTIKRQAQATAQAKKAEITELATEKTAEAKEKYSDLANSAEVTIREKPLTSIAIATGVGLLIGLMTRR